MHRKYQGQKPLFPGPLTLGALNLLLSPLTPLAFLGSHAYSMPGRGAQSTCSRGRERSNKHHSHQWKPQVR